MHLQKSNFNHNLIIDVSSHHKSIASIQVCSPEQRLGESGSVVCQDKIIEIKSQYSSGQKRNYSNESKLLILEMSPSDE